MLSQKLTYGSAFKQHRLFPVTLKMKVINMGGILLLTHTFYCWNPTTTSLQLLGRTDIPST